MMEQYGLNEDKIKIFPSGGINFDVFQEIENAKEKLHLDPNKKCIGYIGRYEKRKGWEVFLKAISLLENVEQYQIVMVGVGEDEEKCTYSRISFRKRDKKISNANSKRIGVILFSY